MLRGSGVLVSSTPRRRFIFLTSNPSWGGSEELWSASAAELAADGHEVAVFMVRPYEAQPRIRRLRALGCRITELERPPLTPRRLMALVAQLVNPLAVRMRIWRWRLALAVSARA